MKDFYQRLQKAHNDKARRAGNGTMVDRGPCTAHLRELSRYGVPVSQVSAKTGIPIKTLYTLTRKEGTPGWTHRTYAERIMAVQVPEGATTHEQRVIGATRILQGLGVRGWSMVYIGEKLFTTPSTLKKYTAKSGQHRGMSHETYQQLVQIAQFCEMNDPAEHGVPLRAVRNISTRSINKGFYDIGAWDLDTVHLPESKPNQTGECGKVLGVLIHKREGQAVCLRCQDLYRQSKLDLDEFIRSVKEDDLNNRELAQRFEISEQIASKYRTTYLGETAREGWHLLSDVSYDRKTAYCSQCRDRVQVYRSGSSGKKLGCANKIREGRQR